MATKARFYRVALKNGYGSTVNIFPAQRGDDLNSVVASNNIKVENIDYLGWYDITIIQAIDEIYFSANVLGTVIEVYTGDVGYEYLLNQFRPIYNKVETQY